MKLKRSISMRKFVNMFIPVLLAMFVLLPVTQGDVAAAASKYKDGEYGITLNVLKNSSDEASIASDYINSAAKLIVKDGKNIVQANVKDSSMLKSLSVGPSAVTTVSENKSADTRVIQFEVADLSQTVNGSMHVVVPKTDDFPGYDKEHEVRFSFDASGVATAGSQGSTDDEKSDEDATAGAGNGDAEDNPPTSDNAPILLFTVVLLASGFMLVRKFAFK